MIHEGNEITESETARSFNPEMNTDDNSLFSSFAIATANEPYQPDHENSKIEDEVERYFIYKTDAVELMMFWGNAGRRQFPKLYTLAKKVLSVQASSVASESAFSTQGNIQTDDRNRLTPGHVEELLFLHYYYQENSTQSS